MNDGLQICISLLRFYWPSTIYYLFTLLIVQCAFPCHRHSICLFVQCGNDNKLKTKHPVAVDPCANRFPLANNILGDLSCDTVSV